LGDDGETGEGGSSEKASLSASMQDGRERAKRS
jgi:hypothetical protein